MSWRWMLTASNYSTYYLCLNDVFADDAKRGRNRLRSLEAAAKLALNASRPSGSIKAARGGVGRRRPRLRPQRRRGNGCVWRGGRVDPAGWRPRRERRILRDVWRQIEIGRAHV